MRGKFFLIIGTSGVGKRTLINFALQKFPNLKKSISVTTRPPRKEEIDKIDYYFITKEEYLKKLNNNEIIMHYEYPANNEFYGTLVSEVITPLEKGKNIIDETDITSLVNMINKKILPRNNLICIFITVPTLELIKERLESTNSISDSEIKKRIESATKVFENFNKNKAIFDYCIVNGDLESSTKEFLQIIKQNINN